MFDLAIKVAQKNKELSVSVLQRKLKINYNSAKELIDKLISFGYSGKLNNKGVSESLILKESKEKAKLYPEYTRDIFHDNRI